MPRLALLKFTLLSVTLTQLLYYANLFMRKVLAEFQFSVWKNLYNKC